MLILPRQVVLLHGRSRVVAAVLKHAARMGKHFSVIVTEGRCALSRTRVCVFVCWGWGKLCVYGM
jgi:translation initiation factor 2B subunit (eIF-2B alpha/beta/delta family)